MTHSAKAVANTFLQIAEERGEKLSPLKLLKLVYIAHGWHLGFTGEPLIGDELAEAWQYGPVFPSIYHEFKEYGKGAISGRATEYEFPDITENGDIDFNVEFTTPYVGEEDEFVHELLNKVWNTYGKYSAFTLSNLTHKDGSPWEKLRSGAAEMRNIDIPNEIILDHYKELIEANRKKREAQSASV